MRILCRTHSINSYENAECDYAIIDLTPELAKTVATRHKMLLEMQKKDDSLLSLHFQDEFSVHFYRYLEYAYPEHLSFIDDHWGECRDFTEIPDGLSLENLDELDEDRDYIHQTAHSDQLIIYSNHFVWVTCLDNVEFETEIVKYERLAKLI